MHKPYGTLIKIAVLFAIVGGAYLLFIHDGRVVLSPGVKAPFPPEQVSIEPIVVYEDDEHSVTAVAEFAIQAKVLSRKRYRTGRESAYSPVDFALGWQRMSDQSVVDDIDVSSTAGGTAGRPDRLPIPQRDIERCSANMHMLPSDDRVREKLLAVRTGEVIAIEGYLVNVSAAGGWSWNTSTSREDTGDGACEIVWVEALEVVETD